MPDTLDRDDPVEIDNVSDFTAKSDKGHPTGKTTSQSHQQIRIEEPLSESSYDSGPWMAIRQQIMFARRG
jgi:hypothetical protein